MFRHVEKQQLKVPAHIDYLGDLRDFVTQIGRKHKFSDKVVNAFKLSVDEAATNIIRHAYRDMDGLITIRAFVKKNSLSLSIIDQGMFFDPKRVKDPDLNKYVDIGKKGGLGIFIMRKLMDEIDYRKTDEGNELRITKYRDKPVKKGFFGSVGNIPFSIKAKYFFRAIGIITVIIGLGYFYFFLKTDDELISDFLDTSGATSRTIVSRIGSAPAEDFTFVEDIVYPIEEEYKNKIARISIEDSLGTIVYSTNVSEILSDFHRPANAEKITKTVYKYALDVGGEIYYEFDILIIIKQLGTVYGKAHVYFSASKLESEISSIRLDSLQFALFILGMSYVGIALLIYLVMIPFRKLSDWVKNVGQEEVEDSMDIDASSEIGEIARAFSDIQSKFRDSQKNLVDQERLQREMQVAQEIQQTLLPMEFPELDGYQLAAYYEAAKEVGGDYYDFVEVDKDSLGIVVADVSGKGVPGSLVMTMIRTALRTEARGIQDAAEVLTRVNAFVSNDIKKGMFVTVFYLIIDAKRRRLNYASAGHNPMILYRGSTKQTYYLNPKGFPIGVQLPDPDYFRKSIESDTIQLAKNDILLLYTDGITEAMNSNRQLYGEERLQQALNDFGDQPATKFIERLKDNIYSFTEGAPQYDDITLVAIKEQSTREEDELRRAKEVYRLAGEEMSIKDACEQANLASSVFYNKYRKIFDEDGIDAFEIDESVAVEAKHLSIEEKSKIFDIIKNFPEYGAARIKEELNTKKYSFTNLSESRIYDELVRNRLNTKHLREAFISKAQRNNRRIKSPGTPFMTLDGTVVVQKKDETRPDIESASVIPAPMPPGETSARPPEQETPESTPISTEQLPDETQVDSPGETVISDFETEVFIDAPIDEILANSNQEPDDDDLIINKSASVQDVLETETDSPSPENSDVEFEDLTDTGENTSLLEDFSFDELFVDSGNVDAESDKDFDAEGAGSDTSENTAGAKPTEPSAPLESASAENTDDNETALTSSSVEELLGENQFEDADDDAAVVAADESAHNVQPEPTENQNEDTVSFSDLIQAIDEEIVYVTESPSPEHQTDEPDNAARFSEEDNEPNIHEVGNKPPHDLESENANPNPNGHHQGENGGDLPPTQERETILVTGIKHYKNNNYDQAIEEFRKVIHIFPDYKEAHSILGNAYFRNKMYNEAAAEYQRVKEIDPADITAYENMGVIFANRGEYRQAVGEWKKVIELSPERADIEGKIRKALRLI